MKIARMGYFSEAILYHFCLNLADGKVTGIVRSFRWLRGGWLSCSVGLLLMGESSLISDCDGWIGWSEEYKYWNFFFISFVIATAFVIASIVLLTRCCNAFYVVERTNIIRNSDIWIEEMIILTLSNSFWNCDYSLEIFRIETSIGILLRLV